MQCHAYQSGEPFEMVFWGPGQRNGVLGPDGRYPLPKLRLVATRLRCQPHAQVLGASVVRAAWSQQCNSSMLIDRRPVTVGSYQIDVAGHVMTLPGPVY